jgi:hypothetical protein
MQNRKMTILELFFERNDFTPRQMIGWFFGIMFCVLALMMAVVS